MTQTHAIELSAVENPDAELGIVSMPVPSDQDYTIDVEGARSQSVPIEFWPRSESVPGGKKRTRRALVFFEKQGSQEPIIHLKPGASHEQLRGLPDLLRSNQGLSA